MLVYASNKSQTQRHLEEVKTKIVLGQIQGIRISVIDLGKISITHMKRYI